MPNNSQRSVTVLNVTLGYALGFPTAVPDTSGYLTSYHCISASTRHSTLAFVAPLISIRALGTVSTSDVTEVVLAVENVTSVSTMFTSTPLLVALPMLPVLFQPRLTGGPSFKEYLYLHARTSVQSNFKQASKHKQTYKQPHKPSVSSGEEKLW